MKTIIQKVKFNASPKELFDIFLDSKKHSDATGGKASVSRKIGEGFTAWDGYIRGKNLAIVPHRMIVQSWRTSQFKKTDLDSLLILTFEKEGKETLLTMVHADAPDALAKDFTAGWKTHYWNPMKTYLKKTHKK